jgi:two-component system sensor histidine kinase KdpD
VGTHLGANPGTVELHVETNGTLASPFAERRSDAAEECWISALPELRCGHRAAYLLTSAKRRLGVLVLDAGAIPDEQVAVLLPLVSLAIQRCILAEQLGEADLVRRSEQFKTALLSSVSHDLRTPLAAISASAGSLAELGRELDDRTRSELLGAIQEQCGRLDRFTRNLLNLGRIEGGLTVEHMPIVDAMEVLGATLGRVRRTSLTHPIERAFAVDCAPVRADESLMEQVFLNLLENAVTHTPAETPVRVSARVSGDTLVVAVEDNGHGIPEAERERVFERFHQVRANRTHRSGSGLGLSIAKGFTELFGGTIEAGTAHPPLHGARLELRLPLWRAAA